MDINTARSLYSIQSVLGWNPNRRTGLCPLPQHQHHNNTPSFSIVDGQRWQCFGASCGRHGDVVDLVGYMKLSNYDPHNSEHVKEALSLVSGKLQVKPPKKDAPRKPISPTEHKNYIPADSKTIEYALSRGITKEQISQFQIGTRENWMTIPTFENGILAGIKLRNINKIGYRYTSIPGSRNSIWGLDDLLTEPVIMMVKGEICAMIGRRFGFPTVAPTCGEAATLNGLVMKLSLHRILLIGDNNIKVPKNESDDAVIRARKRAKEAGAIMVKFPPAGFVGWDDWALACPEEAIEQTQQWLEITRDGG